MMQYMRAGQEDDPTAIIYEERVVQSTEQLETNSGHVVAMTGMHVLESTSEAGDVIVVHPDDLANSNLWQTIP